MPKKVIKKVAQLGMGNIMVGGLAVAAGGIGHGAAAGLSGMSRMMPVIGTATMAGETVRIASKNLKGVKRNAKSRKKIF